MDQSQTVGAALASDWCQETFVFFFLPNRRAARLGVVSCLLTRNVHTSQLLAIFVWVVRRGEKKLKLKKTRGVWNWSVKTLPPGALSLVLDFSSLEFFLARFDFFAPPLTAPGSPRMDQVLIKGGPIHK